MRQSQQQQGEAKAIELPAPSPTPEARRAISPPPQTQAQAQSESSDWGAETTSKTSKNTYLEEPEDATSYAQHDKRPISKAQTSDSESDILNLSGSQYTYDVDLFEAKEAEDVERATSLETPDHFAQANDRLQPVRIVSLSEIPETNRHLAEAPFAAEVISETKFAYTASAQRLHGAVSPSRGHSLPSLAQVPSQTTLSLALQANDPFESFESSPLVKDRFKFFYPRANVSNIVLVWDFPICGCDSFKIEGLSILTGLIKTALVGKLAMVSAPGCLCEGMAPHVVAYFESLRTAPFHLWDVDVFVSHKPPHDYPIWPYRGVVNLPFKPKVIVGRSMVELLQLPKRWSPDILHRVDEIWVPSHHSYEAFHRAGMSKDRLHIIHEPVDTDFYDARLHIPHADKNLRGFNFLSVFKWEPRKGVDILIRAFFSEFTPYDDVALVLHTYLFGSEDPRNPQKIRDKVAEIRGMIPVQDRPAKGMASLDQVVIISEQTPAYYMPRIYRCAHAFVLPTRGEGWGLPYAEAMSMSLPVIATNWSGPAEFITPEVGYLIRTKGLSKAHGIGFSPEDGDQWIEPDIDHLRELMRHVFTHRDEARAVGERAARYVRKYLTQEAIAGEIGDRLAHIMVERGIRGSAHYADRIAAERQAAVDRRALEILQERLKLKKRKQQALAMERERTQRVLTMETVMEYVDDPEDLKKAAKIDSEGSRTGKQPAKLSKRGQRQKEERTRRKRYSRSKRDRRTRRSHGREDSAELESDEDAGHEEEPDRESDSREASSTQVGLDPITFVAADMIASDDFADALDPSHAELTATAISLIASKINRKEDHYNSYESLERHVSQAPQREQREQSRNSDPSPDQRSQGQGQGSKSILDKPVSELSEREKAIRLRTLKRGHGAHYEETEARIKELVAKGESLPHPRPHLLHRQQQRHRKNDHNDY